MRIYVVVRGSEVLGAFQGLNQACKLVKIGYVRASRQIKATGTAAGRHNSRISATNLIKFKARGRNISVLPS